MCCLVLESTRGVALNRPRLIFSLFAGLFLLGGILFGHGIYIYAKADVAQLLLINAWRKTKLTHQAVKPWPWADTWPVARMWVPSRQVDLIVLAGDTGRTLAFGPGYHLGSALPGANGNSIISAHRDTHFHFLNAIHNGDEIFVENNLGQQKRFIVKQTEIIDSRTTRLSIDNDRSALTLVTCYPFDAIIPGGPLRYIVYASEVTPVIQPVSI